jgi:PAS domain S-box-containing protein
MKHAGDTPEHTQSPEQHWRIFDSTLSSLIDFVYTFDRERRFLYANKPLLDLWGLTLEDSLGKNFFDLQYPAELAERLQRQIQQVFATGQRLSDETPYTSVEGTVGYYEYVFYAGLGISNTVELVAGATGDISVRKAAERASGTNGGQISGAAGGGSGCDGGGQPERSDCPVECASNH